MSNHVLIVSSFKFYQQYQMFPSWMIWNVYSFKAIWIFLMTISILIYSLETHSLLLKILSIQKKKRNLFNGEEIDFINRPLHKFCFVSLQKKHQFFCTNCKKAYNDFFEKKLHVFSRIYKNEWINDKNN